MFFVRNQTIGVVLLCIASTLCYSQADVQTTIKLKECVIEFTGFSYNSLKTVLTEVQVQSELGLSIENALIKVSSTTLDNIQVEERFETSISISDEGPHCDLVDWKHYLSEWRSLKEESKSIFRAITYSEQETAQFPTVDMSDVAAAVAKLCSTKWMDLVSKAKSPNDYPCGVSVSKYFLRVKGAIKNTDQKFEKVITIIMPMGC